MAVKTQSDAPGRRGRDKAKLPVADARRFRYSATPDAGRGPRRKEVKGAISYRAWRPGDELSILDGFNQVFGLDRGVDYWTWKFCDPKLDRFLSVAVDEAGTVHAFYGAMPTEWQFDGGRKLIGLAADVFSRRHPRIIRENAFVRVLKHFLSENLGPGGLSLIQGFAGRTPVELYEKHVEPLGLLPLTVHERAAEASWRAFLPKSSRVDLEGDQAIAALDALWSDARNRYPRSQIRDTGWAIRRFQSRPDRAYEHFVIADGNGAPQLWWVAATSGDVLEICDLVWNGDPSAIAAFDHSSRRVARQRRCTTCRLMIHNDPTAIAGLQANGWQEHRHPEAAFWVMQTGDPDIDASILESVYLTFGDTDMV